jgi:Dihydroorotate dehydrogenase
MPRRSSTAWGSTTSASITCWPEWRRPKFKGVLGINIGKNFDTPVERAVDDYLICLDKVYAHASYVTSTSARRTPRACAACNSAIR